MSQFHCFNSDLAEKVGVIEAIVFNSIAYFCKKSRHKSFDEQLPCADVSHKRLLANHFYLTQDEIMSAIEKLIKECYISEAYNNDGEIIEQAYIILKKGLNYCN